MTVHGESDAVPLPSASAFAGLLHSNARRGGVSGGGTK